MAKGKGNDKDIQERRLKREITFPINTKEKDGLNDLLLKQLEVRDDLKREFKSVKQKWAGDLKANDMEIRQTRKQLKDNTRTDVVMVTERKNYKKRIVEYLYEGKPVESRDMTQEDLQTEMPVSALATEEHTPKDGDVADVIKLEKNKRTKKSAVDGQPTV